MQAAANGPCVADTSLLSYFVFTGNALLLKQIIGQPVYITPVVLDPTETTGAAFLQREPLSELLRPLFFRAEQPTKFCSKFAL